MAGLSKTGENTVLENQRLRELEELIKKWVQFGENKVAPALYEIREKKLYKAEFRTFDDYCEKRWGMHRSGINFMLSALETRQALTGMIDDEEVATVVAEISDRALRPLCGMDLQERKLVVAEALDMTDGRVPTGTDIIAAKKKLEYEVKEAVLSNVKEKVVRTPIGGPINEITGKIEEIKGIFLAHYERQFEGVSVKRTINEVEQLINWMKDLEAELYQEE